MIVRAGVGKRACLSPGVFFTRYSRPVYFSIHENVCELRLKVSASCLDCACRLRFEIWVDDLFGTKELLSFQFVTFIKRRIFVIVEFDMRPY